MINPTHHCILLGIAPFQLTSTLSGINGLFEADKLLLTLSLVLLYNLTSMCLFVSLFQGLLLLMLSFTKDLMKGMHTLEGCLELEFTLLRTPQKATNTCTEQGEEPAVPHTKTGPVTSATGRSPAEFPHIILAVLVFMILAQGDLQAKNGHLSLVTAGKMWFSICQD